MELIEVGDEIPIYLYVEYNGDALKEGQEPALSDLVAELCYNDRTEAIDDKSVLILDRYSEEDGDIEYTVVYEKMYNYNGEELYVCCRGGFFVSKI